MKLFLRTHPEELIVFFLKLDSQTLMHETLSCIMKWMRNRQKYFLLKGVLLDEFLHMIYDFKVYDEKCFILLYVFQNPFEYCKVKNKQTIYLLFLLSNFFLLEKTYKLSQKFFWSNEIFSFWLRRNEIFLRRFPQHQRCFYITPNHSYDTSKW